MHTKPRNRLSNGHWSNAMSVRGQVAASRSSPEGSIRGLRMHNSGHRNNSRGNYGRGGHSKKFQQLPTPSRGDDIFMEAGRLAAEYLVSKGVLPPNALSGKCQIGELKNHLIGFQRLGRNADNMQAHTYLESSSFDVGGIRNRYSDNTSPDLRDLIRERRGNGSIKKNGSELNKESGKIGSWDEMSRDSHGIEADGNASTSHSNEQPVKDNDDDGMKISSDEINLEGDPSSNVDSELERYNLAEDLVAKIKFSNHEKSLSAVAEAGEHTKEVGDSNTSYAEAMTVDDVRNDNVIGKKEDNSKNVTASERQDALVSKDCVDLVKFFKFAPIPTKARSSLTVKGSRGDLVPRNQGMTVAKLPFEGSVFHAVDVPDEPSASNTSSGHHEINSFNSDVVKATSSNKDLEVTCTTKPEHCPRSTYNPETSVFKEQDGLDEKQFSFGHFSSMVMDRVGKRAIDDAEGNENFKKPRVWTQIDSDPAECLPLSSSMEDQPTSQLDRTSHSSLHAAPSPSQKNSSISAFSKIHDESHEFMGSFKTCDLNLTGTYDANENQDSEKVLSIPSSNETVKETVSVDVGLSMSNSFNLSTVNAEFGFNSNDIEVIDLDNDSAPEEMNFSHHERRVNSLLPDLDGFPNNLHNTSEIPDVQDGYGLMFSELLGNDSPNSSSVPADLISLHNHLGLPPAEGMLAEDDSIYMSLGEIPISFLRNWEQPTPDYRKPF